MSLRCKVHSLTGRISLSLTGAAFANVRRNRGAAGIDRVSVEMFAANLGVNLLSLIRDLKDGTFVPCPLRRVYIPKGQGQFRPLGIPTVRDRVAQEVLRQLLSPLWEERFHDASYGFRPGRNCQQAVSRVLELHRRGYNHVLDADIQGFFDQIPQAVIMTELSNVVADGKILGLVEKFLQAGVLEDGVFQPTARGTPQGGVVSPLLANITLNVLDWHLHDHGYRFVRYADDFVVLCRTNRQAREAWGLLQLLFAERLGLCFSPEKTKVTTFREGFTFLGFAIKAQSVQMRTKSQEKFKDKVREITRRSRNLDAEVVVKLNRVLRGTANYFATAFSHCVDLFRRLDRWVRMRLRCMRYKRKSKGDNRRMRHRSFRRLGVLNLSDFACHRRRE